MTLRPRGGAAVAASGGFANAALPSAARRVIRSCRRVSEVSARHVTDATVRRQVSFLLATRLLMMDPVSPATACSNPQRRRSPAEADAATRRACDVVAPFENVARHILNEVAHVSSSDDD